MAKPTLKTVERKTTVSRDAISIAFAEAMGTAKSVKELFGNTVKKTTKKHTRTKKKDK